MVNRLRVNESHVETKPMTIMVPPGKMAAAVAPPSKSTISWVAGVGMAVIAINQGLVWTGHNPLPPDTATEISAGIGFVIGFYAWLKRSFFHDAAA